MKRIALLLIMAVCSTVLALALDIVTLTDGRVIRGQIVSQTPGQSVTIENTDGVVITYPDYLVKKMRHEDESDAAQDNERCRGFRAMADWGEFYAFSAARGAWFHSGTVTAGYQLNRYLFVGAGLSPEVLTFSKKRRTHFTKDTYPENLFFMPLYVMGRFEKKYIKTSPFLELRLGDNFIGKQKGLYGRADIGCRINHVNISAGYSIHRAEGRYFFTSNHFKDYISSVGLRIGYDF